MSYPPATFGRSAHGIPNFPAPFDIWNDRYRLAQNQWLSCMVGQPSAWSKEEQVADTGTQISCTGWVLLYNSMTKLAGGITIPALQPTTQEEGIQQDPGRGMSAVLTSSVLPRRPTFL